MGTIKRTNPGDAANIFVRCMLSDISDLLGGFQNEELEKTVEYFDYKCPYTDEDISVEYKSKKWALDHLIPHNRESIGLNLYGNIIVTTKETNAKKAAKSFEDFIRYETKGTEEEKEKRIKKIRQFQQDAGYFEKVKNVDELKELCKKSYDEIQNKLKSFLKEYEKILGVQTRTDAQVSSINRSFNKPFFQNTAIMQMPKFAGSSNGMTKPLAIQMAKKSGIDVFGQITYASLNKGAYKYWANPNVNYLLNDWWLILNDVQNKMLHVLLVPANSLQASNVVVRADNPLKMDLQINYNDNSFTDCRSKIAFGKWFVKSIEY